MPIFGETLIGSDFDMGPGGKGSNQKKKVTVVLCGKLYSSLNISIVLEFKISKNVTRSNQ